MSIDTIEFDKPEPQKKEQKEKEEQQEQKEPKSKETYLKGEKKKIVIEIIRECLAFRIKNDEILDLLSDEGIHISERTLRRLKSEAREVGKNVRDTMIEEFAKKTLDDVLAYEQLTREGWRLYQNSNNNTEKLKAMTQIRQSINDKMNFVANLKRRWGYILTPYKPES